MGEANPDRALALLGRFLRTAKVLTVPFGEGVALPEPVGIELDTRQLLDWARVEKR